MISKLKKHIEKCKRFIEVSHYILMATNIIMEMAKLF
mgnify:CR=1 FL=1